MIFSKMNSRTSQSEAGSLPKGWASAQLGDVSDIIRGISFPKDAKTKTYQKGYIACLRTTNVQREVEWSDLWFVPKEFVRRDQQLLQKHDILISTANSLELVGKVCQMQMLPQPATLGAFIAAIRISPLVNPKFFYFQIASSDIQASIRACASTTTNISNVNTNRLKEIQLTTSPFNEQRRIVAKIEELFTRLDAGVEALKKVKAELKRYRQAVLKYAFEGKLTADWREKNKDKLEPASKLLERIAKEREKTTKGKAKPLPPVDTSNLPDLPDGWEWAVWETILAYGKDSFKRGPFGSALKKEIFVSSGYKVYEQYCPINDDCSFERYYITPEKYEELKTFAVKQGDFLVSCSGVTLGRITQVPEKYKEGIINQALLRIRINSKAYDMKFFKLFFRSLYFQNKIFENSTGSAIPNVKGVKELKAIPVPLISLEEQNQIAEEIERQFSITDEVEQTIEKSLKEADRLRQSILKRAFEGKLVTQDAADEPAEKLLERIKAEKANSERKLKFARD